MGAEPLIDFRAVSMEYQSTGGERTTVFRSLGLTINAGEFACVIGPSGCGKTTLLNMIAGFVAPTSGEVLFKGQPIREPGAERGCVFQEYSLFPWLTVEENVEFGLRCQGVPAGERRDLVERHLSLVGLANTRKKYPFELSGGMQQRVGIARALINNPAVLLMDEPFAALDAITRNTMQSELLSIWKATGTTVFYITHNIEEAVFLGTRAMVMSSPPAMIAHAVQIELPHPRERTTADFNAIYRELETALYSHIDPKLLRKS
ncbi:MAG: ABC transporter ATP-binding protein [Proteobacteria bacterium]|nr:ABC transporter ATP-binding protein [Pseudomonadota bacterium]